MKGKYVKPLLIVLILAIAGMAGWNIYLQRELYKYKPQVEAYLPEDVYVAVGSTIELYGRESATAIPAAGTARSGRIWRTAFPLRERKNRSGIIL